MVQSGSPYISATRHRRWRAFLRAPGENDIIQKHNTNSAGSVASNEDEDDADCLNPEDIFRHYWHRNNDIEESHVFVSLPATFACQSSSPISLLIRLAHCSFIFEAATTVLRLGGTNGLQQLRWCRVCVLDLLARQEVRAGLSYDSSPSSTDTDALVSSGRC